MTIEESGDPWVALIELARVARLAKTSPQGVDPAWSLSFSSSPVYLLSEAMADLSLALANQCEQGWKEPVRNPDLVPSKGDKDPWPKGLDPSSSEGFTRIVAGPESKRSRRIIHPPNPEQAEFFRKFARWVLRFGTGRFRGSLGRSPQIPSEEVYYHLRRRNQRRRRSVE